MSDAGRGSAEPGGDARDAAAVRSYEEGRYRGWDQRLVHHLEARIIRDLIARVSARGDRILDVPCGYGRFTRPLSDRAGTHSDRAGTLVAADLRLPMLRRARERVEQAGVRARKAGARVGPAAAGVAYCAADILRLPFPGDSFDGVLVVRLLQHFHASERRVAALREVARVTSRWAVVTLYADAAPHRLLRRLQGRPKKGVDADALLTEIATAGLRVMASRRPIPGFHAQTVFLLAPTLAATRAPPARAEHRPASGTI